MRSYVKLTWTVILSEYFGVAIRSLHGSLHVCSNINHYDKSKFFRWSSAEFRNSVISCISRQYRSALVRIREALTLHNVDLRSALFHATTCSHSFFSPSLPLFHARGRIGAYFDANRTRIEDINVGYPEWNYHNKASLAVLSQTRISPFPLGIPLGSQMNYRTECRKSPANFSFGHLSIFHRVTPPPAPPAFPARARQPAASRARDCDDKLHCVPCYRMRELSRLRAARGCKAIPPIP